MCWRRVGEYVRFCVRNCSRTLQGIQLSAVTTNTEGEARDRARDRARDWARDRARGSVRVRDRFGWDEIGQG
ncbi:hypothetical protein AAMO2058_001474500 [Amorphochlora amoebiformis]